jgi:hypothetical protein
MNAIGQHAAAMIATYSFRLTILSRCYSLVFCRQQTIHIRPPSLHRRETESRFRSEQQNRERVKAFVKMTDGRRVR